MIGERPTLFELELEGLAEERANPPGIQPGRGTGLADEGDGAAHAKRGVEGLEVAGEAGQGVEQVGVVSYASKQGNTGITTPTPMPTRIEEDRRSE